MSNTCEITDMLIVYRVKVKHVYWKFKILPYCLNTDVSKESKFTGTGNACLV